MVGKHGAGRQNKKVIAISLAFALGFAIQSEAAEQTQNPDTAASHAKIFGLFMGMPLAQLERELSFKKEDDMYVGIPPEQSDLFGKYGVIATKKSGLCDVVAMTSEIKIDDAGDQVKSKVDEIAKVLEIKYGHPSQKIATLKAGYTVERPKYWALDLSEGAVSYGYVWKSGEKGTALPGDLDSVTVMAFGFNVMTARANLQYSFKNTSSCKADIRADKAAKL
jgi:hypothetical protein